MSWNRQRTCATIIGLGIWVLLLRTILMTAQGYLVTFVPWVAALLALELLLNVSIFVSAAWWWMGANASRARLPLHLTTATIIIHAIRVLVFVLGRTGPWHDFDVRAIHRTSSDPEWHWVIFAAILAILSPIALASVWLRRRSRLISP